MLEGNAPEPDVLKVNTLLSELKAAHEAFSATEDTASRNGEAGRRRNNYARWSQK